MREVKLRYKHENTVSDGLLITNEAEFWEVYNAGKINCVSGSVINQLMEGERIVVNSKGGWCTEGGNVTVEPETKGELYVAHLVPKEDNFTEKDKFRVMFGANTFDQARKDAEALLKIRKFAHCKVIWVEHLVRANFTEVEGAYVTL